MANINGTKLSNQNVNLVQDKIAQRSISSSYREQNSEKIEAAETMMAVKLQRFELLFTVKDEAEKDFSLQGQTIRQLSLDEIRVDSELLLYNGKRVSDLTTEEAAGLVSKDGYYGISKTAERLAQFVIRGGGNDLQMLQAGREGIIKGFNEAEKAWGGKLPEISYKTLEKALEQIDARIQEQGGSLVDTVA